MASDCPFCKIVAGEIPAKTVYEDDLVHAFHDNNPQSPTHILVIPRKHIASLVEADAGDRDLLGHLLLTGARVATEQGLSENGFRSVINTGEHGGQSVHHIHLHIMGGRPLNWPPG